MPLGFQEQMVTENELAKTGEKQYREASGGYSLIQSESELGTKCFAN